MDIQIELILLIPILIILIWMSFEKITKNILLRRYKPENDKGRNGEDNRRRLIEADKNASIRKLDSPRFTSVEGQDLLQATETSSIGKTNNSDGEVSRKFFNPFKRR